MMPTCLWSPVHKAQSTGDLPFVTHLWFTRLGDHGVSFALDISKAWAREPLTKTLLYGISFPLVNSLFLSWVRQNYLSCCWWANISFFSLSLVRQTWRGVAWHSLAQVVSHSEAVSTTGTQNSVQFSFKKTQFLFISIKSNSQDFQLIFEGSVLDTQESVNTLVFLCASISHGNRIY